MTGRQASESTSPNQPGPVIGGIVEGQHLLFVTGRLAECSLREVVTELSQEIGFQFEIVVPGVQVAALLHTDLLLRRLQIESHVDRVILPGWCRGDLQVLEERFRKPFERGPKDLFDLPEFFGQGRRKQDELTEYSIEIIAEINHATLMPVNEVVAECKDLAAVGANMIDVGCVPGESSVRVGELVAAIRDLGLRASIDSFDRQEVEQAVHEGAELVLSCNHSNLDWVSQLDTEVVAIPDRPDDLNSLDDIIEHLTKKGTSFRVDPIIEPIGMGFTASLQRYMSVRQRYPEVEMMMGTGNITELTEVDSAGVNMLLAAICEELRIHSVLTTQVINWCRTSVAELDVARRMVHYSVANQTIPKNLMTGLLTLRDARLVRQSPEALHSLAEALTDSNFRIYAEQGGLHLMNSEGHWSGGDVFQLFSRAMASQTKSVDASHAFYLGYELARAEISRQLGRNYTQDEPMDWGVAGTLPGSASIHSGHSDNSNPSPDE